MASQQQETNEKLSRAVEILAEQAIENKASRQKSAHEVLFVTPWNKSGKPRTVKLVHKKVTQNGALCNTEMMSDEEIEAVNKLRPGKYNKGKIVITRSRDKSLDIRYANKTVEQRFANKDYGINFLATVKNILIEQEDQERRRKAGEPEDEDY